MRILYTVYSSRLGGGEMVCLRLIRAAIEHGYQVTLTVPSPGPVMESAVAMGVPVFVLPLTRTFQVYRLVPLLRLLRQQRIDLIHTHDGLPGMILARLGALVHRIPIINHVHTNTTFNNSILVRTLQRVADNTTSHYTHAIICVSEDTRRSLIEQGLPSAELCTIPNGVELKHVSVSTNGIRSSADLKVSAHRPLVGCVARLAVAKGQHDLVDAARIIHDEYPEVRFVFLGEDTLPGQPYAQELQRQVERGGLQQIVHFAGFQPDAASLMHQFDVVVLPSYQEAMPLTILEAMAAGKPVVATHVNGVPEVVLDGVTGLLVPPGAPDALAAALIKLINDPILAAQMGRAGRHRVETHFDLAQLHQRIFAMYEQAVGR